MVNFTIRYCVVGRFVATFKIDVTLSGAIISMKCCMLVYKKGIRDHVGYSIPRLNDTFICNHHLHRIVIVLKLTSYPNLMVLVSNIEVLGSTLTRKTLVLLSKKRIHGLRIILKIPNDIIDILYHFFPLYNIS